MSTTPLKSNSQNGKQKTNKVDIERGEKKKSDGDDGKVKKDAKNFLKAKIEPEKRAETPEGSGNRKNLMISFIVLVIIGVIIGVVVAMGGSSKSQQGRTPPEPVIPAAPKVIISTSS